MLQDLNAKNSEHELSIEKFLTKSEEAFFGKVRKQKLDDAASIRSSYRDSMWGTPAVSMYSTAACMTFFTYFPRANYSTPLLAPNMHAFPQSEYDPPADPNAPPVTPMTGLQIIMSREIKGWPLYTIVIALGQVS